MNPPRWFLMILFRPLRLLVACLILGFVFLKVAMKLGKDNPNSHFFDPTEEVFQKSYSDSRKEKARNWIQKMDSDLQKYNKDSDIQSMQFKSSLINSDREGIADLSVVFVTIQRPKEQYLDASLGSFLMELQPLQRQKIHISISFGGEYEDPSTLPFFRSAWLHGLTDQVIVRKLPREQYLPSTFNKTSTGGHPLPHAALTIMPNPVINFLETKMSRSSTNEWQRRGTSDYSIALEICEKRKSKYCLIVEDDVVFKQDWFEDFEKNLRKSEEGLAKQISPLSRSLSKSSQIISSWAYIRLFYAERYFGWENEEVQGIVFVCTLVVGSFGLLLLLFGRVPARYATLAGVRSHLYHPQKMDLLKSHNLGDFDPDEERKLGGGKLGKVAKVRLPLASQLVMILMVLFLCILFILSGRNLVYKIPDGISEMNSRGCCTQANLYQFNVIPGLKNHLRQKISEKPYHNLINQWVDDNQKSRIAISPPLVQHIGVGTKKEMADQTYLASTPVWSFAFERRQLNNVKV